jgi:thermitase
METPSLLNCVVILFLGTAAAQPASTPTSSTQTVGVSGSPGSIRAGHILVRFKTTPGQDVINQLNTAFGAKVVGRIDKIGVTHLQAPPEAGLALLGHLRNRRDVEFAEFDSPVQAIQSFVPDDIYYSTAYASSHHGNIAQWGPQAVSAPAAWGVTRGDSSIVIAIVDTGVDDTHPDLASKIVGEYSYVGKSAKDGFGHGTHCAGIAAADTNNVVGIAGMCPNCGILSVKVLDDQGSGFVSDVASGITYAASHGARVISLSLGGSGHTETLHSALDYAIANNALPVCAMGNNGSSSNTPEPGYWHDCLSVIATDQTGAKASFSNYGAIADVAAPGVAILSTMPTYPVTLTTAHGYFMNYDALSGTSMATPMVAGVAGLMLSQNPSLTPTGVAGIIEASSGDGVSWTPNLAFGVVNAFKAVSSAMVAVGGAPFPNLVSPGEGATVSGLVTVQAAPTGINTVHHVDIVQNGSRFVQPLTGVSTTTCTSRNKCTSTPPWTVYWPSTLSFNTGLFSLSVLASDVFGNSGLQARSFSIQNRLVSQSWTQLFCVPATSTCPSSVWFPVTTGVATQAAVHLQGTINYNAPKKSLAPNFGLKVQGISTSGTFQFTCVVFNGATVDCYPPDPFDLYPDIKGFSNSSGAELEVTSPINAGTVQWTLTYPQ